MPSPNEYSAAGSAVTDLFGGIGLLHKAKGSKLQAAAYDKAAELALLNKKIESSSTEIKEAQASRDIYKQTGGQQADIAAAGFAATGSALDIMRESASQGALTKAVISQQGLINEATFQEQHDSYVLMAEASREAAKADTWGAVGKFAGAAIAGAAAFSDARLKRDITLVGHHKGLRLYRYRYLWSPRWFIGVMAQELLQLRPAAVIHGAGGFLRVDYGAL